MLVPAILKKEELIYQFSKHLYDNEMFLYRGRPHINILPDITPEENSYRWAIVDSNGIVVGYFAYHIDVVSDTACDFGMYSFKENNIIGLNVYRKMIELINTHRRIEWCMIAGNPAEKSYDKLCKMFNGNKLCLHKTTKDNKGNYVDSYIYEILRGE